MEGWTKAVIIVKRAIAEGAELVGVAVRVWVEDEDVGVVEEGAEVEEDEGIRGRGNVPASVRNR